MVASAASLLLRYAGRSLQRPIPRALEELRLSPRGLKDSPRRLYSSDGIRPMDTKGGGGSHRLKLSFAMSLT
uniref:Uncharacterized protein n=2 Tax=Oryza TaxID=4527 RepID=A0A0E0QP55_ORYRU